MTRTEEALETRRTASFTLTPTRPFHFDATVHKPSHFPTRSVDHQPGIYWQSLRYEDRVIGLRMVEGGTSRRPLIDVSLFSDAPVPRGLIERLRGEIAWRFDLDADLTEFRVAFRDDPVLGPALARWEGMRVSCAYSLYEFMTVAIVLQNATVRRSVRMLQALFERYGTELAFDGRRLYAFWSPERMTQASEDELRALKVGYRARSLKRVTDAFAQGTVDELAIRAMDRETARRELLKLYGIGPASVWYLLFEVFHHYDAFDVISPWEQKIYSRLLFGEELVPAERILDEVRRRWGRWRMLASHYVFEDLFWRRRHEDIAWLTELIRL